MGGGRGSRVLIEDRVFLSKSQVMGQKVMNRSKKAARYGALAEQYARERYGLDADHDYSHDARTDDGRPVEVKAAMLNRASGQTGRFRLFEEAHRELAADDGIYVFVAYEASGRGIRVRRCRAVAADEIEVDWYGAGGHRDSQQVKIPPKAVFS